MKFELDLFEKYGDKFRDLRVAYMGALEQAVKEGETTLSFAVDQFEIATGWPRAKAAQYLKLMSGPDSCFKRLP